HIRLWGRLRRYWYSSNKPNMLSGSKNIPCA
ncbi:hypothetical protein BAE44_0013203, partial [Dichanthelium oligosanthes]